MSLRIGLFYPNARSIHAISPEVVAGNPDVLDLASHVAVSQAAEEIGLDYLFMADAWGPYGPRATAMGLQDPMLLAPILAAALFAGTTHIRFITTVHTSWFHPLLIARMGAALDQLSNGRWGINLVSGSGFAEQLGGAPMRAIDHDARYIRAEETVEIITRAWAGARVDFDGEHFKIHGALVGPRTRQQPRPLIVSAGASDAGRGFAGRHADYIFMPGRTPLEECQRRVRDIRAIAAAAGRPPEAVRLQMHASIIVRETAAAAAQVSQHLADTVDLDAVAEYLNGIRSNISTYDDIYASLGELQMRQVGSVSGARKIHGGPQEVADGIQMLAESFGCGGIAVTLPVWSPEEIRRFGRLVLPVLERRGLWQHPRTRDWAW